MTALTETLLAHTADVTGLPLRRLRSAASPVGDDLDAVRDLIAVAQCAQGDEVAAVLDQAIQKLVSARHNIAPGSAVRRYLPELRPGLALVEGGRTRFDVGDQEWRRSDEHPTYFADQNRMLCDPRALPASLVVVEASAERSS